MYALEKLKYSMLNQALPTHLQRLDFLEPGQQEAFLIEAEVDQHRRLQGCELVAALVQPLLHHFQCQCQDVCTPTVEQH